jgi:hypothetical protein
VQRTPRISRACQSQVEAVFEKSWRVMAHGGNGIWALEPPPRPQISVIRCKDTSIAAFGRRTPGPISVFTKVCQQPFGRRHRSRIEPAAGSIPVIPSRKHCEHPPNSGITGIPERNQELPQGDDSKPDNRRTVSADGWHWRNLSRFTKTCDRAIQTSPAFRRRP